MRRDTFQIAAILVACAVFSAPAEARPRVLRVIGALAAAPVAMIAGAVHAHARHHRDRRVYAPRRAITSIRAVKRGAATGWAGPLFWPYASSDLFDYVFGLQEGADRFWSYGYGDVLDGMFVTAAIPNDRSRRPRVSTRIAENSSGGVEKTMPGWSGMCAQPSSRIDALVERLRTRLQPNPEQSTALEALKESLLRANAKIEAACPDSFTKEATDRIALMASRLMAMRLAASTVSPPLRRFYETLDENQKSLFNEVDVDQLPAANAPIRISSSPTGCAEAKADGNWPADRIARRIAPKGPQLAELERFRLTSASFGEFIAATCKPDMAKNPLERLEAARKRVNVLRYAVMHIDPALDRFYGLLNPRQKARFSSLGR